MRFPSGRSSHFFKGTRRRLENSNCKVISFVAFLNDFDQIVNLLLSFRNPISDLAIVVENPKAWEEVWRNHSRNLIFHKEDEHCKEALRKQGFQFTDVCFPLINIFITINNNKLSFIRYQLVWDIKMSKVN